MSTSLLQGPTRRRAHISLTPLIDVVFILLLFFMLSSTFTPISALDLNPAIDGAGEISAEQKALLIEVMSHQQWRLEGREYAVNDEILLSKLSDAAIDDNVVVVQATTQASVQDLVSALSLLQARGITRLNVSPSSEVAHD
ncbi:MAG: biopolymer transporter ExbD [Cellvibrionaceae bacterium]|nr:biopolymer transporter ExbD [Cellvibrionaceae bacterium]|tara:strand:- start:18709 stop:19131 length:423 start_codon:yes stop_codon:yes gene_type:complete